MYDIGRLNMEWEQWFGDAFNQLIEEANVPRTSIAVIGWHGQTIAHYPSQDCDQLSFTTQIGVPAIIADRTNLGVVRNFVPWIWRLAGNELLSSLILTLPSYQNRA